MPVEGEALLGFAPPSEELWSLKFQPSSLKFSLAGQSQHAGSLPVPPFPSSCHPHMHAEPLLRVVGLPRTAAETTGTPMCLTHGPPTSQQQAASTKIPLIWASSEGDPNKMAWTSAFPTMCHHQVASIHKEPHLSKGGKEASWDTHTCAITAWMKQRLGFNVVETCSEVGLSCPTEPKITLRKCPHPTLGGCD